MLDESRAVRLLHRWGRWAEAWWYDLPGHAGIGYFGTGYDSWGVQTNQKYAAAMAVLSTRAELTDADRDWARNRALASLRFSLRSHVSGDLSGTDGRKWGHSWISGLGIERMMHGVAAIADHLTAADRNQLRRVFESESDWLLTDYHRAGKKGIQAGKWGNHGPNDPESNLWNGAILWRSAEMYPDHPHVDRWRERSAAFMAAGVSIDTDASDATIYDGRPLRERHIGANFFDSFALDHHAYFNIGYMVICQSNAAIAHFDLKRAGLRAPELLHLHQADLWRVLRPMIFPDGRLARLGGDTRVRYAYCQEYLPPSLLNAADHLGDDGVAPLLAGYLGMCEKEAAHNGDGSFYSRRLAALARRNPYYYVRIEGDRANGLSMALAYAPLVDRDVAKSPAAAPEPIVLWTDREYGAALHRSPTRLASFTWPADGLAQGLCLPPDRSDLAEWEQNLGGTVQFVDDPVHPARQLPRRRLVRYDVREIAGGFITSGTIVEGAAIQLAEGWHGENLGLHYLAFVALPDGHTVVGMQVCRSAGFRTIVQQIQGMRLNVPNDLYNDFSRTLTTAGGELQLAAGERDEIVPLASRWATIDGCLSVVGLYGADQLVIDRSSAQRGGSRGSIHVEQICYTHSGNEPFLADPDALLLDCAWMVSTIDARSAADLADRNAAARLETDHPSLRAVSVTDVQGNRHTIVLNAGEQPVTATIDGRTITLSPGAADCW